MLAPDEASAGDVGARSPVPAPPGLADRLLRAAFGDDETARGAWLSVAPNLDIETLPYELHELLAPIGATLRRLGLSPIDLPRFEGIRKRLWATNARRLHAAAGAVGTLRDGGLRPIVVGRLATLLHHGDLGVGHLVEAEIAVPSEAGPAAVAALQTGGWRSVRRRHEGFLLDIHAVRMDHDGQQITLRWGTGDWPHSGASAAVGAPLGVDLDTASPTDVLAYTLTDGLWLPGYLPARRYADALLLCRQHIDWGAFAARVASRNASTEASRQLAHVAHRLGADVPPPVLARLSPSRSPSALRRGLEALADGRSTTALAYLRRVRGVGAGAALTGVPAYLREVWDLPPAGSVRREVARRSGSRLVSSIRASERASRRASERASTRALSGRGRGGSARRG